MSLVLGGCAQPIGFDDALAVVPYELQPSGRIVVEVRVNREGPFRFALDTASSGSFVFARLRDRLALPESGRESTVRGAVASGRFPLVHIDTLEVGSEIWRDAELIALPGDTDATAILDGILGTDFLRRYAVGFSVTDEVIRLYAPSVVGERSYQGWSRVALTPMRVGASSEPLYLFDIAIEGHTLPALFDLGAGLNVINRAAVDLLDLTTVRRREAGELSGAIESRAVLAQFGRQVVTTGRVQWRNELFLIDDLAVLEILGYEDRALAIMGSGLFAQRDFVIDFARNRLLIRTSMSETDTGLNSETALAP